jgi:DnaJ-class molecular chaperone
MAQEPDYYEILQVHPSAEAEVIDAAYRRLARKYHPDVNTRVDASERMKQINAAFEVLGNSAARSEYDRRRGHAGDAHASSSAHTENAGAPLQPQTTHEGSEGFDVAANLFRGIESVGGRLFLTPDTLLFKSHRFNLQTGETEIPMSDVREVTLKNTLGVVPNGLLVLTKDGKKYRFVVSGRQRIMEFIREHSGLV